MSHAIRFKNSCFSHLSLSYLILKPRSNELKNIVNYGNPSNMASNLSLFKSEFELLTVSTVLLFLNF